MQYQVSYGRDTVYARNVEYIQGNSSSCIPISYLYKSIEAVTIFNTEKFFSKGLYDTGYHHTEKFAYKNKSRKVDVFNVGTFAFYFNKKYMFSSNGESVSKTAKSAGEQNNNIFGKLERGRDYAILDHVFANDIKNAIHEDNVFGKKLSLDTIENEVKFANHHYKTSTIRQYRWLTKVHQRSAESNEMTWIHEEKNLDNESISCYGVELLKGLNINQDILGKSRVNINLAIGSDGMLLYKDKSDARHNEAYQLFKGHHNLDINSMNGVFKDIPDVSINNSTIIDVENPDLKLNEYLATYKETPLLRIAPQITIKTNNRDLKINESSSISSPIRELKKNEDVIISLDNKDLLYTENVNVGSIIRDAKISEQVNIVTTKGGLKLDSGIIPVIRDVKRVSVNEDIVIDLFSKQLMIRSDLEFFKYKKATFKNEYIGVNIVNKMVAKGEGYSVETRYRGLKEEEMYSLTPKDKDLAKNEYKIISDLIKEVYLETEQGITKYVKEFKNTVSDKPLFLSRDEDYGLIINDMSIVVKNYKGLIENKNTIITKNLKDSSYFNKFDNLFIERNILTMNYTEVPVSIAKAKKRAIENIETIIIKNMQDTFKGQCVAIEKPNLYRASVVQDVIIQKDLKGTMYIRELYVAKEDYNMFNYNQLAINRREQGASISKDVVYHKASSEIKVYNTINNVIKNEYGISVNGSHVGISNPLKYTFIEDGVTIIPDNRDVFTYVNETFSKATGGCAYVDNSTGLSKSLDFNINNVFVSVIVNEKDINKGFELEWYLKSRDLGIDNIENWIIPDNKNIVEDGNVNISKKTYSVSLDIGNTNVSKTSKELLDEDDIQFLKYERNLVINSMDNWFIKGQSLVDSRYNDTWISREDFNLRYGEDVTITKGLHDAICDIYNVGVLKGFKDTIISNKDILVSRPDFNLGIYNDTTIQKGLKLMDMYANMIDVCKGVKGSSLYNEDILYQKAENNTNIFDSEVGYNKAIKDCMIDNDMIGYGKIRKSLDKYEQHFISKRPQDTYKESITITYDKGPGSIMVDEEFLYGVMKNSIDTGIDNTDVGYVKNSSDSVYDKLIGYDKYFSSVYIEPNAVLTKGPGNVTIDDGSCSWFSKFNTMDIVDTIIKIDCSSKDIDNSSVVIEYSKNTSDIMQDENIRIDSSTVDIGFTENVNVTKGGVATLISKDETVSTTKGSLNDDDTSTVLQSAGKQSNANNIIGITKGTADTSFDGVTSLHDGWNNLNIDKTIEAELKGLNMSKYDNESINIAKEKKDTQENKNVVINKAYLAANNDDVSEILSKALKEGGENNNVIISKLGHLVEKVPGLQKIIADREFKEVYIECSGKWVDGDEYDKPSLTGEGIDELLLPGTDYDYTKLEGTVIDSNGKPIGKNIEVIDNRTFITSTPVKHPLPETSNIGIEYIDLNVNVLRHLIDVTYKLWMKKAFKFGATDMRDAMSILMEDLISYVDIVMDEPDKKHAERVLRLIRWYGEAAINNHAKYKIKVDFKKLSSDLYEGDCKIPYSFDNMHIDNNMYTITNTVTGMECSAEFYIDNPVDTKVQFILQVTSGTARVSINGEEVATVGVGMHRLEYDIEKLDKPNVLNIFYNGLSNGIINISNVVIFDMRYQGYTLEYHAVRGTGNKVMDNLIKYLANYEDMLSNNMEYIEAVKDNNYAITDVISRLLEYYDLHHEGKDKGKRITIKK